MGSSFRARTTGDTVSRKTRLEKLEQPAVERWRKAWESHAVIFDKHAGDIFTDEAETLRETWLSAYPELDEAELWRQGGAFLESLGVAQYEVFEAWFNSYDIPEDDPPDLTRWPSDIPAPPNESPGEWEKVAPYRDSDEPVQRLAAEVYLFLLATARAAREERAAYGEAVQRGSRNA